MHLTILESKCIIKITNVKFKKQERRAEMQIYTVALFGHREVRDLKAIEEKLAPIVKELIQTQPYVVFLIGRNGEFDIAAASMIKGIQKVCGRDNSELTLVLPYPVADLPYYENYYDSVIIPDAVSGAHPKSAITLKNRWMVEQAELVIVNVERDKGGAYAAMRYAERLSKTVVNLAKQPR